MSGYQTWYPVAPSTGCQRTRPGFDTIGTGSSSQLMLKPNGRLQSVAPRVVTARTCAQSAYGLPVNQGSVRLSESAGMRIGAIVPTFWTVLLTSPPWVGVMVTLELLTARQERPDSTPSATFDQMRELDSKVRLA